MPGTMGNQNQERALLDWLLQKYPETPRTRAKQWILAGRIRVNGVVIRKPHHQLPNPGVGLELLERHATTLDCGAGWQIHPRVGLLHLDSALAILNKGAGLVSVPAPNCELSALSILADFLVGKLKAYERGPAGRTLPPIYRRLQPLPVHRLDQYTTGVFCSAMNPAARGSLIAQLKAHTMTREYVAFVEGRPETPAGTWRHWVRLSEDGLRQQIVERSAKSLAPDAQEAITHYQVVEEYPLAGGRLVTKLHLRLETGRKHQIRVHAAYAGLPLIGDRTYNLRYRKSAARAEKIATGESASGPVIDFPRQALHAELLSLEHPESPGKRMTWRAEWPKDLRQLEAGLRAGGDR